MSTPRRRAGRKAAWAGGCCTPCTPPPPISLRRGVFSDGRATYLIEPQAGAEHGQVGGGTETRRVPASVSPAQPYRSGCSSGTALGTRGRGGPPSLLSRPHVAMTLVSPWQGLHPHVVQRVPSCARPGEPSRGASTGPQGPLMVALCPVCHQLCPVCHQLCPFSPGCLFPALNQRVAGGLPKLRRRRQVSGDSGGQGTRGRDA